MSSKLIIIYMFTDKIKLVATDMDGTLLDSHKKMPSDFKSWVVNHENITTVIASGRQYYALARDFMDIKDHLIFIAENGSLVFSKDEIIYRNLMKKEDVLLAVEKLEKLPFATPLLCGVKSAYMEKSADEEIHHATMYYERLEEVADLRAVAEKEEIVKLAIYFRNQMAEKSAYYFSSLPDHLKAVVSGVSWIDVANVDANKGKALKEIQEQKHVSWSECVAFGDYFNDVEMLEQVKYSFATANAHPKIKKLASYLTDSNDDDGVMKVLRKL